MATQLILCFLDPEEFVKLALACKDIYFAIDCNRALFHRAGITDYVKQLKDQMVPENIKEKVSAHFIVALRQQWTICDHKSEKYVRGERIPRYELDLINNCYLLQDLFQVVRKQKFINFFFKSSDLHLIKGLSKP